MEIQKIKSLFEQSKGMKKQVEKCEGCKFYKWHDLNLYNEPTWVKVCRNPKRENAKESSEKCKLKEK